MNNIDHSTNETFSNLRRQIMHRSLCSRNIISAKQESKKSSLKLIDGHGENTNDTLDLTLRHYKVLVRAGKNSKFLNKNEIDEINNSLSRYGNSNARSAYSVVA